MVKENNIQHNLIPPFEPMTRPHCTCQISTKLQGFAYDIPNFLKPNTKPPLTTNLGILYPLSNVVSYDNFSSSHKAYIVAISFIDKPTSFLHAIKYAWWKEAMQKEIEALERYHTWTLEHLPPNKQAIDWKWVYKIKYKAYGIIKRFKAKSVTKGFTQVEEVHYTNNFALITKLTIVRCLLIVAVI